MRLSLRGFSSLVSRWSISSLHLAYLIRINTFFFASVSLNYFLFSILFISWVSVRFHQEQRLFLLFLEISKDTISIALLLSCGQTLLLIEKKSVSRYDLLRINPKLLLFFTYEAGKSCAMMRERKTWWFSIT